MPNDIPSVDTPFGPILAGRLTQYILQWPNRICGRLLANRICGYPTKPYNKLRVDRTRCVYFTAGMHVVQIKSSRSWTRSFSNAPLATISLDWYPIRSKPGLMTPRCIFPNHSLIGQKGDCVPWCIPTSVFIPCRLLDVLGERPGSSQTPRYRLCAAAHGSSHSRHNSHDTCNPSGDYAVVCNVYFPLRRVLRHDGSGRERPGESMAYAVAVMLFVHEP